MSKLCCVPDWDGGSINKLEDEIAVAVWVKIPSGGPCAMLELESFVGR